VRPHGHQFAIRETSEAETLGQHLENRHDHAGREVPGTAVGRGLSHSACTRRSSAAGCQAVRGCHCSTFLAIRRWRHLQDSASVWDRRRIVAPAGDSLSGGRLSAGPLCCPARLGWPGTGSWRAKIHRPAVAQATLRSMVQNGRRCANENLDRDAFRSMEVKLQCHTAQL
jgi:hypothetical protein